MGHGKYDVFAETCPTRQVVGQIGSRWGLLIISALENGPLRFGQMRFLIEGISQKMLTQNLRNLERDGLVRRNVLTTSPVTVEYSLTELASGLVSVVRELRRWSYDHIERIESAREQFDVEHEQVARQG